MGSRHGPSLLPVFVLLLLALAVFTPAWKQYLPLDRWLAPRPRVTLVATTVKVWVSKESRLYYCPDSALYKKVSPGFLLTQGEARKRGYRPAKQSCP